ncbi:MAG TPA: isoleucine--tRNA ligase, partial [Candidatus Omnitrophica bacterium]|nr:isoleucine--tRNA ligase [Candidatus Omnitrophota bacterium]
LQLTTYIIIWTTTPWTIPANLAVALHPEYEYALVQIKNVERWLIAKDLVDSTTEKLGIKDYKVVEMRKGKELEGIHYRHPLLEKNGKIVLADYVSLEEGTGCVHTAPGHGEEDYRTGLKYGLPVFSPVDEKGIFTGEIADLEGRQVFEANAHILQILKECGLLLKTENIQHSYPHCWRCKNPVIFRACKQWFMGVDRKDLRKRALRSIEEVEWLPPLSLNRIKGTLEARPDWCLSRQRLWGVAIPGVYCEKCGKEIVDRHITDRLIRRVKEEGSDAWFRHSVDTFLPRGFS